MKINLTAIFTPILLVTMLGAAIESAKLGFAIGDEALSGITQPDRTPAQNLAKNKPTSSEQKQKTIVPEKEILIKVYDYVYSKGGNLKGGTKNEKKQASKRDLEEKPQEKNLSLKTTDGGVTLEIVDATQKQGALLLEVNLKNESEKVVNFLYSFLDVIDERGRALSAITDGLPGKLPATGENFTGTVSIPSILLDDAGKISLTLTDYPKQELNLTISEIPVVR
ncbi:MAG: hypothetical protein QNJ54_29525 [Prochloraceae cyanobacterium]|nr:hypothetical protein [Prochloraceae cyanobacterium]